MLIIIIVFEMTIRVVCFFTKFMFVINLVILSRLISNLITTYNHDRRVLLKY